MENKMISDEDLMLLCQRTDNASDADWDSIFYLGNDEKIHDALMELRERRKSPQFPVEETDE